MRIERDQRGNYLLDGAAIAEKLSIPSEDLRRRMRLGLVTSLVEVGEGEDAGLHHLPIPVRALQGVTSDWACVMANSSGHMSHDGAHGTGGELVTPKELARLASLQLVATRQLRKVQVESSP
jgi:hypothetical protein